MVAVTVSKIKLAVHEGKKESTVSKLSLTFIFFLTYILSFFRIPSLTE